MSTEQNAEFDYSGFRGWMRRRRCPHSNLRAIYGDEINAANARLSCRDCGQLLDGPPALAESRRGESR